MVEMKSYHKWIMRGAFAFLILANIYWGWYFYPHYFPHYVNIPNQHQINNFCKDKGFDNGWLSSSSCKENEVQCHKKVFDLDKYECVKWGVVVE